MPLTIDQVLLGFGYFPEELPPPFSTLSFGRASVDLGKLWLSRDRFPKPGELARLPPLKATEAVSFNLARQGSLRRRLSIPNPIPHFFLCSLMAREWPQLARRLTSPFGLGLPEIRVDREWSSRGRAVKFAGAETRQPRLNIRAGAKYLLVTDIMDFYGSIYTHTIEWAYEGKERVKRARRYTVDGVGKLLDQWTGHAQGAQTRGLPIGPDSSRVLAELLMCVVDQELARRRPGLKGYRLTDDYEFGFRSLSDAEATLAELQDTLREHTLLALNPRKTKILPLPQPLEAPWVTDLKSTVFQTDSKGQERSLLRLLDRSVAHHHTFPDEHVFQYALSFFKDQRLSEVNFRIYEAYLLQIARAEPGVITRVLKELLRYRSTYALNLELISETLNSIVREHVTHGHSSEVSWALWGLIALGRKVEVDLSPLLAKSDDSIVALLVFEAYKRGLIPAGFDFSGYLTALTREGLSGPNWLLAYQADVSGYAQDHGVAPYVSGADWYKHLHAAGVSFLDWGIEPKLDPLPQRSKGLDLSRLPDPAASTK